jgi:histidinol-phosphate/aromatic aminotransferase/cobyric acid decarboxylase-like protein
MIRVARLAAASAFATQALVVPSAGAPEGQRVQFMAACSKKNKVHICECTYEGAASTLNARELELMIAVFDDDKRRQQRIKSDPKFNDQAYTAKGNTAFLKSLTCIQNRKK